MWSKSDHRSISKVFCRFKLHIDSYTFLPFNSKHIMGCKPKVHQKRSLNRFVSLNRIKMKRTGRTGPKKREKTLTGKDKKEREKSTDGNHMCEVWRCEGRKTRWCLKGSFSDCCFKSHQHAAFLKWQTALPWIGYSKSPFLFCSVLYSNLHFISVF